MGRKLGKGELGPYLTQCAQAEAYVRAKFHLDPSNRLATVHQRYRRQDRTEQRSDSIRRTVLKTVAQNSKVTGQHSFTHDPSGINLVQNRGGRQAEASRAEAARPEGRASCGGGSAPPH